MVVKGRTGDNLTVSGEVNGFVVVDEIEDDAGRMPFGAAIIVCVHAASYVTILADLATDRRGGLPWSWGAKRAPGLFFDGATSMARQGV